MRDRERVIHSLESVYREAFDNARGRDDQAEMARLDFEFQKDQIYLEVLLDLRDQLSLADGPKETSEGSGILKKAQALRRFTKLR